MSKLIEPGALGPNDKVLYEWECPPTKLGQPIDYPDAYVVIEAEGRIVIWGRYPRSWFVNPQTDKLVKHLLEVAAIRSTPKEAPHAP